MRDFFERHKADILGTIAIFGYSAFWVAIGSVLELSDNQSTGLGGLFFLAGLILYLKFKKSPSEDDKLVASILTLGFIALPFLFLIHYLIGRL